MEIKVLGSGCARSRTVMAYPEQAVGYLGLKAESEKVTEVRNIVTRVL